MLQHYFKLQFNLISRKLVDFGISAMLGYPLIAIFFYLGSNYLFQKIEFAHYLYPLIPVGLALNLSEAERNTFLKYVYSPTNYFSIRIVENCFVALPFSIYLIYKGWYLESLAPLLLTMAIILFNTNKSSNVVIPTPFSKKPFEFCVGFRRNFIVFPILLLVAFIAIKVNNLNLGIASICGSLLVASNFYLKPESPYFVWIYNLTPNAFLKNKLVEGLKNVILLSLPSLLLICITFYQNLDEISLFYFLGLLFFSVIILMKYAAFPNEIGIPQVIIIVISLYVPPLLVLLIPYFYREAIIKLKTYLK
ncbi:MAG: hypothetical protein QM535_06015 [Limnohabitans sp.]|nr:hypothetical protein [Limnohabitans sp.]